MTLYGSAVGEDSYLTAELCVGMKLELEIQKNCRNVTRLRTFQCMVLDLFRIKLLEVAVYFAVLAGHFFTGFNHQWRE